ncbi:apolipoprotein N-acyltransferase [Kordiimonas sediminis]|uniref:Apolipoprotein N-acyltransferase n=1 Tax=Kordiimonas sediminis TaxID=1735581 RepID=A0A919AMN9_9PROT|nr:apolipoprotein N-acyltransferase [Kordiimonas sediminis]GHF16295.1 apolipoprotein N-acyltransferase [Kordiimonas sediminis]
MTDQVGRHPDTQSPTGIMEAMVDFFARKTVGLYFLSFLMGVFLSRTFSPYNFFPAVFLVFPVWILLIDRLKSTAQAYVVGWWGGFGLFATGLTWVGYSFTQQDAVPVMLAPLAILCLAGVLSIYTGLLFALCWRLWPRSGWRILLFAVLWTLFEMARGTLFTGFPWHVVGSLWADWSLMAQAAYIGSVYGLSFVTVLAAGCLIYAFRSDMALKDRLTLSLFAAALLSVQFTYGYVRLGAASVDFHNNVLIKVVQANVKQREKWISYLIEDHFDKHLQLSRGNSEEGIAEGAKLLIWPETSVQRENFDREGSVVRWRVSQVLEAGSYALVGAPRYEVQNGNLTYYNSLFAVNSNANLYARYDKTHLVPFGEYLPFASLLEKLGIAQMVGGAPFAGGPGPQTIKLPGVPSFSPLICYEAIFPGAVTDPSNRPEWLLNISNDGWFGLTEGPYQHLALSRFRAIEEGLPLLRSTSTGISAMVDPYGRTLSKLGLNTTGTMNVNLPKALEAPLVPTASKILILAGFLIFLLIILFIIEKRKTN